jgi:hypothetical protein
VGFRSRSALRLWYRFDLLWLFFCTFLYDEEDGIHSWVTESLYTRRAIAIRIGYSPRVRGYDRTWIHRTRPILWWFIFSFFDFYDLLYLQWFSLLLRSKPWNGLYVLKIGFDFLRFRMPACLAYHERCNWMGTEMYSTQSVFCTLYEWVDGF